MLLHDIHVQDLSLGTLTASTVYHIILQYLRNRFLFDLAGIFLKFLTTFQSLTMCCVCKTR